VLVSCLSPYVESASSYDAICVVVQSKETGNEIAVTFDLELDINEYGDLQIYIAI